MAKKTHRGGHRGRASEPEVHEPEVEDVVDEAEHVDTDLDTRGTDAPAEPVPAVNPEPAAGGGVTAAQPEGPGEGPKYRLEPFHAPMSEDRRRYLLTNLPVLEDGVSPGQEVQELVSEGYIALCDGKLELTAKGREALGRE